MKVLLITERFAPDFAGGGEVLTLETALRMRARGCDLRVLTTGDPADTQVEGVPVQRLPVSRYRFNLCRREALRAAAQADLIHIAGFHACVPALFAARRRSLPTICTISALFGSAWLQMKPPLAGRAWQRLERWLLNQPFDRVHLISETSRSMALALGVDPARCRVIPPGIHHDEFQPRWPKDRVVLFSGKLDIRKGIFEFLEVAARLPHVRFEVVGWGSQEAEIRKRATGNVTFYPYRRGRELREHFGRAAIFAMPSHVETFGLALVEAQASGCAIVSSVPLPFAGVPIPPKSADSLAAGIQSLWNDPVLTETAGRRNVDLSRQYDWEVYADHLFREYAALLRTPSTVRSTSSLEVHH